MVVRAMSFNDIEEVSNIHLRAFPFDSQDIEHARKWIKSKFLGWPANKYYVISSLDNSVIAYILWVEMGGFRKKCILELEQIAVDEKYRGKGLGSKMIDESLTILLSELRNNKRDLKLIEVTTGKANEAQRLYIKSLSAEKECIKKDFFEDDEVVMIARSDKILKNRNNRKLPN